MRVSEISEVAGAVKRELINLELKMSNTDAKLEKEPLLVAKVMPAPIMRIIIRAVIMPFLNLLLNFGLYCGILIQVEIICLYFNSNSYKIYVNSSVCD